MKVRKIGERVINELVVPEEHVVESLTNYYEKDTLVQSVNYTFGKRYITDYEFNEKGFVVSAITYAAQEKMLKKSDVVMSKMITEYDDEDRVIKVYSEESGYSKSIEYESSGIWETIIKGNVEEKSHYDNDGKVIYYHYKEDGVKLKTFNLRKDKSKNKIYTTETEFDQYGMEVAVEKLTYTCTSDDNWVVTRVLNKDNRYSVEKEIKYDESWKDISSVEREKDLSIKGKTLRKTTTKYEYDKKGRLIKYTSSDGSDDGIINYMGDYSVTEIIKDGKTIQLQRRTFDNKKMVTHFAEQDIIVYTCKDDDNKKSYNVVMMKVMDSYVIVQAFFSYKNYTYNYKYNYEQLSTSIIVTQYDSKNRIKEGYTINVQDMNVYHGKYNLAITDLITKATGVKPGETYLV